jgi:hypothetical protein
MQVLVLLLIGIVIIAGVFVLRFWRQADRNEDERLWAELMAKQPVAAKRFHPAMVKTLPEPARRFFRFTIQPGTPLYPVVDVWMEGDLSLGSRDNPNYQPMQARQILGAPFGFIWLVRAGTGVSRFSGSDAFVEGTSYSHFWLIDLIPLGRAGGSPDHARSAYGRMIAEALIWNPAALLPREGVAWEAVEENTVRVTVAHLGFTQSLDLTVAEDGRPERVVFQRWSDANPERRFRLQPFGADFTDFGEFGGYRLATRIDAGNHYGTANYFPFYRARITAIRFPLSQEEYPLEEESQVPG